MKNKIKVLLVDDQYLFTESLKMVLENLTSDIKVVATASNGEEAMDTLAREEVDVVLLDVRMPVMDGVVSAGLIKSTYPDVDIIMLTKFEDDEYVSEALKRGAKGYLLKNIAPQMLVSAIKAVRDGSILLAPDLAGHLAEALLRQKKELYSGIPDWYYQLTAREKSIIKLILQGKTNKEIASDINLGEQTVRNYISSIYDKIGVHDRRETIVLLRSVPHFWYE